ncbi:uncharacterized protein ELE39_001976 [Cryptosporidium sp. chipmunk genotype I]|uniref:uncharacterized protein n=1 Tax=Cryptosporidium sp. chipmunk genotype I TaxID=1280935 RepID=UPI003519E176|nr:hypothetical protein ELE39_001976 [Cryptosporidium sp. chipmunk genotype I]
MIFLTPFLSILSYFFLHYLWKYFEKEFGIFTSLFSTSIVILTFYGAYIYFKKSLYIEIDFENFANKVNGTGLNSNSMLSVFERYNKEKENYLDDGLISVKQGEGDSNENKTKKFICRQNETYSNELEDSDTLFHDSKLSFFGLTVNSPKVSNKLYQDNNCYNNSHEICSPSILANTFIQAATIARNYQSEHYRGILHNSQLQHSNNITGGITNAVINALETKSFNSRFLGSVGHSFHSNIKFARSRFENYISSLQFKIANNKVRNSLPGRVLSSKSISESGIKKGTVLSKHRNSSIPNVLIESVDDKSNKAKVNSSTPTRKIYNSFLSPLPTSKPSPILLLTDKNKNE